MPDSNSNLKIRNFDDKFEDVTSSLVEVVKVQLKLIKKMKIQNNLTKKITLGELLNVTSQPCLIHIATK